MFGVRFLFTWIGGTFLFLVILNRGMPISGEVLFVLMIYAFMGIGFFIPLILVNSIESFVEKSGNNIASLFGFLSGFGLSIFQILNSGDAISEKIQLIDRMFEYFRLFGYFPVLGLFWSLSYHFFNVRKFRA